MLKLKPSVLGVWLCLMLPSFAHTQEDPFFTSSDGKANAYQYERFIVAHLHGSDREMGMQHGELSGYVFNTSDEKPALHGFVNYYADMIAHSVGSAILGRLGNRTLHALIGRNLRRNMPAFMKEGLDGFRIGQASSLSQGHLERALTFPDMGEMLLVSLFGSGSNILLGPSALGCSSIIQHTQSHGRVARNFDFFGGEEFRARPTVLIFHPDEGPAYASFTSLSIHTAGVNGVNEHGIYVALHQLPLDQVHPGRAAWPILAVSEDIVKSATHLDEAQKILLDHFNANHISGSWIFTLAGPDSNHIFGSRIIEVTPSEIAIRDHQRAPLSAIDPPISPFITRADVVTNHASGALSGHSIPLTEGYGANSQDRMDILSAGASPGRYQTMDDLLATLFRSTKPQTVLSVALDWDTNEIHLLDLSSLRSISTIQKLVLPFPGKSTATRIEPTGTIDTADARALGYLFRAQSSLEKLQGSQVAFSNMYGAIRQLDDSGRKVPAQWVMSAGVLALQHILDTYPHMEDAKPGLQNVRRFFVSATAMTPAWDHPMNMGAILSGVLSPYQHFVSRVWIFLLDNLLNNTYSEATYEELRQFVHTPHHAHIRSFLEPYLQLASKKYTYTKLRKLTKRTQFDLGSYSYAVGPNQHIALGALLRLSNLFWKSCLH